MLNALAPEACLEALVVQDEADAEHRPFPGSPTVRINGVDIDPEAPAGVG